MLGTAGYIPCAARFGDGAFHLSSQASTSLVPQAWRVQWYFSRESQTMNFLDVLETSFLAGDATCRAEVVLAILGAFQQGCALLTDACH